MVGNPKYNALVIDAVSAKALSRSEIELARSDTRLSYSSLHLAAREQLLRIEAITSLLVDARYVSYEDLVKLEAAVLLKPFREENYKYLHQLCVRLGFDNASDLVVCFRYMRTIDWVSKNIAYGEDISVSLLEQIRMLFNQDSIEAFGADAVDSSAETSVSAELASALQEYIDFVNSDALTPASQAELSHAMLETMRPYAGRLDSYERIFSHVIFYKRGLLTNSVAPLALGPCVSVKDHVKSLSGNMQELKRVMEGQEIKGQYNNCALGTILASKAQLLCLDTLSTLWREWTKILGIVRNGSAQYELMRLFLRYPLMSVSFAASQIGCSFSTASEVMKDLIEAGIVHEQGTFSKHRLYCAKDVIDAFERFIASIHKHDSLSRDELLKAIFETETSNLERW